MADRPARPSALRWGAGGVVVLVVGAFAITVGIGILRGASGGASVAPPDPSASAVAVEPVAVYAHVAGAVARPGLYTLPAGSRIVDAVAAAGGFAPDADQSALNLARPVGDGEQIVVPVVGAPPPPGSPAGGVTGNGGGTDLVDLNTADLAELDTLPRIGPALAQRIIDWREENGRFASVDDLLSVTGIGERLLDGLGDRVRV